MTRASEWLATKGLADSEATDQKPPSEQMRDVDQHSQTVHMLDGLPAGIPSDRAP